MKPEKLSKFRYTDRYKRLSGYFDDDSFSSFSDAEHPLLHHGYYHALESGDEFIYKTTMFWCLDGKKPKIIISDLFGHDCFLAGNLNPKYIWFMENYTSGKSILSISPSVRKRHDLIDGKRYFSDSLFAPRSAQYIKDKYNLCEIY